MIKQMSEKLLVTGSGLTGALCACLLKSDNIQISMWDKARGCGGRMSTSRHSDSSNIITADLGAQYISATPDSLTRHKRFYEELTSNGTLKPLTEIIDESMNKIPLFPNGTEHFITPKGVNTIVKNYVNKSGAQTFFCEKVIDVTEVDGRWRISSESGLSSDFDYLIMTMPVPQILQLKGSIAELIDSQPTVKEKLQQVTYSSRFAMGLFYDSVTKIDVPWCAKYYTGDPSVRFISIDTKKRGIQDTDSGTSVVVHASAPFSIEHLEEDMNDVCNNFILPSVKKLLPQLPEPSFVKNLKWRYSQVHHGYEGSPGAIVLKTDPLLILAGDAFTKSGFAGCIDSALKAQEIFENITSKL